jgi:hypothetical protein
VYVVEGEKGYVNFNGRTGRSYEVMGKVGGVLLGDIRDEGWFRKVLTRERLPGLEDRKLEEF